MNLTKLSETAANLTLGWSPPSGVGGYVFYANGVAVSTGSPNLKDGSPRKEAKFSKTNPGPPFRVAAVCLQGSILLLDVGTYAEPSPPPTGDLPFAEAALRSGFETLRGNSFGSSSQPVNGGEDCLVDLEGTVRSSSTTVWTKAGQRVHIKNGRWKDIKNGLTVRSMDGIGAEHVSATDMRGQNLIDGFVPAGNPNSPASKVTFQKFRTDVPSVNVNDGGEHADAVQVQGMLKRLEIGMSTFWQLGVSGGSDHPGKGLMLNTFAQAPFEVDLDHVNYRALLDGTGAAIFKGYTSIKMRTHEVYYDGPYWGTSRCLYPTATFSGDTASWPASANWTGVVKRGLPPGGDFCP